MSRPKPLTTAEAAAALRAEWYNLAAVAAKVAFLRLGDPRFPARGLADWLRDGLLHLMYRWMRKRAEAERLAVEFRAAVEGPFEAGP